MRGRGTVTVVAVPPRKRTAAVISRGWVNVMSSIHEGVDLQRVWKIAIRDLPTAKAAIAAILPPLDQLERELAGDDQTPQPGT